jgi:hypothetical protein
VTPNPQVRQGGEALKTKTWTLNTRLHTIYADEALDFADDLLVPVIELEPVLDLLEETLSYVPDYFVEKWELDTLLREHGRLQ